MSSPNNRNKVGILGGTFDPIHVVHLIAADTVLDALKLDEVWFIPSNHPPHKKERVITNGEHRIKMLTEALKPFPEFILSTIEFERESLSYSFDTMRLLKDRNENTDFFFIMGADMVQSLPTWYRYRELLELVKVVALSRPGFRLEILGDMDEAERELLIGKIQIVDMPQLEISSTRIRDRVRNQQSIRFLVPEAVRRYIKEHHLYVE